MLPRRTLRLAAALVAVVLAGPGCDGDCIDGVDTSCSPLYEPTFDQVFARTLQPSCGREGFSCHGAEGRQAGLAFVDAGEAYRLLVEGAGDEPLVDPGDSACSPLVARLFSNDPSFVMPPGAPLSEAERCAIVQWIAKGAER